MKLTINNTPKFFTPENAVEIAKELNETDDWTYTPTNPTGEFGPYSQIEIHDEDGEYVGNM